MLCRFGGHTCAACCFGDRLPRPAVAARLRRQTDLFRRWFDRRHPERRQLRLFEFAVRPWLDLIWAVLLWVPGLNCWLRPWLKRRAVCAFLGFEDADEARVGCLLHPARWGIDLRQQAAFAFWRGFGCGAGDYFCHPAWMFRIAPWTARQQFAQRTAGVDWFIYSSECRSRK
jgi:hypothetical protein